MQRISERLAAHGLAAGIAIAVGGFVVFRATEPLGAGLAVAGGMLAGVVVHAFLTTGGES